MQLLHVLHVHALAQARPTMSFIHLVYYILYISRTSCRKSLPTLILRAFLRHSLIQKLFTNYSYSTQREDTICLATARTETTRGLTYSMAGTIGTTAWQKGFICRCHYLCCHQWRSQGRVVARAQVVVLQKT